MARETMYFVQGFEEKSGSLKPSKPARCKSQEGAMSEARRLSETMAGAVAFSSSGDPEMGDYDDSPTVLSVFGEVPAEFLE